MRDLLTISMIYSDLEMKKLRGLEIIIHLGLKSAIEENLESIIRNLLKKKYFKLVNKTPGFYKDIFER